MFMYTLVRPRLMAVGTADDVNMLFANGLVKKAGGQSLVRGYGFMTYRTHSCNAGFAFWVAVRAALDCHKLVWDFHWAIHLGNKLFAYKKLALTDRAFYRLHV